MTPLAMARTGYAANAAPLRTPRAAEYDAIARVTARLRAAAAGGPAGFGELSAALHENRRLWSILAGDVADKDNGLPSNLRARLFYLAEFTELHSKRILAGEAVVAPLIEVNMAIMRGLRGTPEPLT